MSVCVCVCVCVCVKERGREREMGGERRAEGCVREGDTWKEFHYPVAGFHG